MMLMNMHVNFNWSVLKFIQKSFGIPLDWSFWIIQAGNVWPCVKELNLSWQLCEQWKLFPLQQLSNDDQGFPSTFANVAIQMPFISLRIEWTSYFWMTIIILYHFTYTNGKHLGECRCLSWIRVDNSIISLPFFSLLFFPFTVMLSHSLGMIQMILSLNRVSHFHQRNLPLIPAHSCSLEQLVNLHKNNIKRGFFVDETTDESFLS